MAKIQKDDSNLSRRDFLALATAAPLAAAAPFGNALPGAKHIPIGLELYSVRDDLEKDLMGTVRGVAKMGYECVEFYSPYYEWTSDYAKQVRKELDDLHIHCYSTHNDTVSFTSEGIGKAIELNQILGARYIVLASAGDDVNTVDGWKRVAETLNKADEKLAAHSMHVGYHNHDAEWRPVEGQKPLEVLAANTRKSVVLQLDVGTCLEAGGDPVAWIEKNPGRIRCMHCKDWSPQNGYKVLFGEGVAPWKRMFAAAEKVGGLEFYLIEQEGSKYPEMETAERCLEGFRKIHA